VLNERITYSEILPEKLTAMPTGRGGVRNSHFRLHNTLGMRVTTFSEQNVGVKTNNLSGLPANKMVSESLSQ